MTTPCPVLVILDLVAGIYSDRLSGSDSDANLLCGMDPCEKHRDDDRARCR
jgi:hypothetical protein